MYRSRIPKVTRTVPKLISYVPKLSFTQTCPPLCTDIGVYRKCPNQPFQKAGPVGLVVRENRECSIEHDNIMRLHVSFIKTRTKHKSILTIYKTKLHYYKITKPTVTNI